MHDCVINEPTSSKAAHSSVERVSGHCVSAGDTQAIIKQRAAPPKESASTCVHGLWGWATTLDRGFFNFGMECMKDAW